MAEKYFNVTGCCDPTQHYMADVSAKFAQILKMVERGDYFAINRPRQYGKTTMLNLLFDNLSKVDYVTVFLSFEGVGDLLFENESAFSQALTRMIAKELKRTSSELAAKFQQAG